MKKIIPILFTVFIVLSLCKIEKKQEVEEKKEIRAIYISYIELSKYLSNKNKNESVEIIKKMVNNVYTAGFNFIILHVRSFSDSIYPSEVFINNYMITRDEDINIEIDLLEEFIKASHEVNIEVHAWINPYRIRNEVDFKSITEKNPCFKWIGTENIVVIEDKGIFYNPASSEVNKLILKGVKEIIENYDVDGIHLDDYFYPASNEDIDRKFYQEYLDNGGTLSLKNYRYKVVNSLISSIYKLIKDTNKNILFGISPDGNVENNYNNHYADILTWLEGNSYVDYIMPQLYYGFKNQNKPFTTVLNEWNSYIKNEDIFLIPALALYKTGNLDAFAGSGQNEWMEHNNIISNQIKISRNISNYRGFSIFRYDSYFDNSTNKTKEEIKKLEEILKNKFT